MNPAVFMEFWQEFHGRLTPSQQRRFLAEPIISKILSHPDAKVYFAVKDSRILSEVLNNLEQSADGSPKFPAKPVSIAPAKTSKPTQNRTKKKKPSAADTTPGSAARAERRKQLARDPMGGNVLPLPGEPIRQSKGDKTRARYRTGDEAILRSIAQSKKWW